MSSPFFALVRFQEKTKTIYVARSNDIKDFQPVHSTDFDENDVYEVLWQDGTESFDGYFTAKIICMAASLPDLKDVALGKGIRRLPPSYQAAMRQEREFKASQEQTVKAPVSSPSKRQLNADILKGKKRRMTSLLSNLMDAGQEKSSPAKTEKLSHSEALDETLPVDHEEEKEQDKEVILDFGSKTESYSILKCGNSHFSNNIISKEKGKDDDKVIIKEGDKDKNEDKEKDDEDEDEDSDDSVKDTNYNDEDSSSTTSSGSEGSSSSHDSDEVRTSEATHLAKIKELEEKILHLTASCKISEESRLKYLKEIRQLQEKLKHMEKENEKLRDKIKEIGKEKRMSTEQSQNFKKLEEENKSLKALVKSAQNLLASGLPSQSIKRNLFNHSTPDGKASSPVPADMNFSFDLNDNVEGINFNTTPSAHSAKTPLSQGEERKSLGAGPFSRDDKKKSENLNVTLVKSKKSKGKGLTEQEIRDISERVKRDLTGEELMPVNSKGKIEIGGGLIVTKEKWDKVIKVQNKNTLFIKKLGTHVYGPDGLSKRTIGSPKTSDKVAATPQKVDAFVACLRGKLLASDPTFPNVDKAAEAARNILAHKMQDDARDRESKAKAKPNTAKSSPSLKKKHDKKSKKSKKDKRKEKR